MTSRRISGYAAISEDGMLANADGVMPDALKITADQQFFEHGVTQADLLVHGRHPQEPFASTAAKPRLITTHQVQTIAAHPSNPKALFWNPAGASFAEALTALGTPSGNVVIVGATNVFAMFLDSFETFYLTRVANLRLPGGTPVFPTIPTRTPEQILAAHGMVRGPDELSTPQLTITRWQRNA